MLTPMLTHEQGLITKKYMATHTNYLNWLYNRCLINETSLESCFKTKYYCEAEV